MKKSEEQIRGGDVLADPYQLPPDEVAEPPATLWAALKRIGPGMILAASIVGSGELIATTTLGAQVGYTALWVIVLSCLIKPVLQAEMRRYINRVPGPRWRVNWVVWAWALMTLMTLLQVGAMFGGVSQVMNLLLPSIPVRAWVLVFWGITLAILLGGGYERIERLAMIKVGLFTMLTFLAAVVLMRMPQLPFSGSPALGRASCSCIHTGASRRDMPAMPEGVTARLSGIAVPMAGCASCDWISLPR
jgi:manganese transport protein